MGAMFLLIGLVPGVTSNAAPFLALYGISYFFTEFGPKTITFVCPAELFPVQIRTTGHGISAALGKMGAFLFPVMLASSLGIRGAEVVAALGIGRAKGQPQGTAREVRQRRLTVASSHGHPAPSQLG